MDRTTLLAFGLPSLPIAAISLPLFIYLPPFYGDELGLSLAAVGTILFLARLWDMVTDPAIGWLSDRFGRRYGRRRTWVVLGTPIALIGVWHLFVPPDGAGTAYLLTWSLVAALGSTMMLIPYNAWGAELSGGYHERSRIFSFAQAFFVLGTLVGIVVPGAVEAVTGDRALALETIFWVVLVAAVPTVFWLIRRVPEGEPLPGRLGWRQGLDVLWHNRPFRRLMSAHFINAFANGLPGALFLYFVQAVIQEASWAGPLLMVYFGVGLAALPLWLGLARRIGKHRTWCCSMAVACAAFVWVPFIGEGDVVPFLIICIVSGTAVGIDLALPAAIQADVIDEDTARSGTSRAGLYYALWGMITKLSFALSIGVAYPLLEWVGFDPSGENTAFALFTLAALYGLVPTAVKLGVMAMMWNFPLDATRQAALRSEISAARSG